MMVNVRVDAIAAMLQNISKSPLSYLDLLNTDGRSFFRFDADQVPAAKPDEGKDSVRYHSEYTN